MRHDLPARLPAALLPILLVAACGDPAPTVSSPTVPDGIPLSALTAGSPLVGTWSGIVTDARDLNQASFGRDPANWVGRTVQGTFVITPATAGIGDNDPSADHWIFQPIPGPGPFTEFVTLTATIGDQAFVTTVEHFDGVFFGDVTGIADSPSDTWFRPQDSFVYHLGGSTGRTVIGFDAFFAPGGVAFDGTTLRLDPARLTYGYGVIDDLLETAIAPSRQGTIWFTLTDVRASPVGLLLQAINQLEHRGEIVQHDATSLRRTASQFTMLLDRGKMKPACNHLTPFISQATEFAATGRLTPTSLQLLIAAARATGEALGC